MRKEIVTAISQDGLDSHTSYNDTIRKIRDSNSKILYLNATNIKSFIGSLYKECRKEEA